MIESIQPESTQNNDESLRSEMMEIDSSVQGMYRAMEELAEEANSLSADESSGKFEKIKEHEQKRAEFNRLWNRRLEIMRLLGIR